MRELVLHKNNPAVLRQVSSDVIEFGSALNHVVDDLTYVMRSCEKAIGIAAIQMGEPIRIGLFELDYGQKKLGKPLVMINPVILSFGGLTLQNESCLSLPGTVIKKRRSDLLKLRYRTVEGVTEEKMFRGIWARCAAHEIDHMNGKLITD